MRKSFRALVFSVLAAVAMPTMAVDEYSPDFMLHNLTMDTSQPGVLVVSTEAQAEMNLDLNGTAVALATLGRCRLSNSCSGKRQYNKVVQGNLMASALALDGRMPRTNL